VCIYRLDGMMTGLQDIHWVDHTFSYTFINSVFADKTPVFEYSDWFKQLHTSYLPFKN